MIFVKKWGFSGGSPHFVYKQDNASGREKADRQEYWHKNEKSHR